MPRAARMFDYTSHPGLLIQGSTDVFIAKLPAARMNDLHVCLLPPLAGPHPPSTIAMGSTTVFINKQPAARQFDAVGCGAQILGGAATVSIGG